MKFKIEHDVPINHPRQPLITSKYPFASFKPGDSAYLGGKDALSIAASARDWGARHGQRWCRRRERKGFRIWRVT